MPFNIIRDDITNLKTDAIVNAANSRLKAGGGVCGAIFSAAGDESLQKACDEIGFCPVGSAVITDGFDLKAKYIIHTVGPVYGQNPANEAEQLYSCYQSSLKLARENSLDSIAFPVISSGIYGYPKTEAIKIATQAIRDFLKENEMDVYLVVYDKKAFQISQQLFDDVQSYIDERMIREERCIRRDCYSEVGAACDEEIAFAPQLDMPLSLEKKMSLDSLLKRKTETFSQMLLRMIDEKGMTDVEVYKRANIDRKLFSKIRKSDYTPKKITVIALIIALQLDMDEASTLLARAGYAFSASSKFDIIIQYFIEKGIYDIFEINETLFAFEQQLLGA